jgi:hypothetical protein
MTETTQQTELRIVNNFIHCMSKSYREINQNCTIVNDILIKGSESASAESCIVKCRELGIDPYGYEI